MPEAGHQLENQVVNGGIFLMVFLVRQSTALEYLRAIGAILWKQHTFLPPNEEIGIDFPDLHSEKLLEQCKALLSPF